MKTMKKQPRITIRLSAEEYAELDRRARGVALAAYVRAQLFGADPVVPARKDRAGLAKVLGLLGQAVCLSDLRHLAAAARAGSLLLSPEVLARIDDACEVLAEIKSALMEALGIKEE